MARQVATSPAACVKIRAILVLLLILLPAKALLARVGLKQLGQGTYSLYLSFFFFFGDFQDECLVFVVSIAEPKCIKSRWFFLLPVCIRLGVYFSLGFIFFFAWES